MSEFWKAIKEGDLDKVRAELENDPELVRSTYPGEARSLNLESDSPFTNTALHFAAIHDQVDLAQLLLEKQADVNTIGYEPGRGLAPALVLATAEGGLDMVRLLLDSGADPNLGASAETALYTAIENQMQDKVELLLERGARHDVFTAAMIGDCDLTVYFLEACPPLLKARSLKRNRTPWDEAATHEQDDVMSAIRKWTDRGKEEAAKAPQETFWEAGETWEGESSEAKPSAPAVQQPGGEGGDWEDWVGDDSAWPG